MNALILQQDKSLKLLDVNEPRIVKDDDVLIQIKATGICGTDIHILGNDYSAKSGIILGHESSGVVLEIGKGVTNVQIGDKIILDPTYHCSKCYYCRNDRPNYCVEKGRTETGVSRDGTFAKYHVVNAAFLHHMPKELSFEVATLTEPLSCVLNALSQTRIRPEFRVLIIGAGPIGLLFGLATKTFGCEVTLGDVSKYRIQKAKELFNEVQNYRITDLQKNNINRRYDLIIDTSGKMFEQSLTLVDKGGDLLVIGLDYSLETKFKPSYLTDNGIRIIGSIDSNCTFDPAITMLKRNKDFEKIITHTYPISDYIKAFGTLGVDLESKNEENKNIGRKEIQGNKVVILP